MTKFKRIQIVDSDWLSIPRIPRKQDGVVHVYVLHFGWMCCYVGQTVNPYSRLYQHFSPKYENNRGVYRRFKSLTALQLMGTFPCKRTAHVFEKELIADFRRSGYETLNKINSPPGFKNYARTATGNFRCRICLNSKPRSGFTKDRSRSSGLSNKCKICYRNWERIKICAIREGVDYSKANLWAIFRERKGDFSLSDAKELVLSVGGEGHGIISLNSQ